MSSYSYVGIFFGVSVAICLFAGTWLDGRFHTKPWFTLVGALLGVATGFVELYRVSKKALRNHDA
jgi:ATP synthase protein I